MSIATLREVLKTGHDRGAIGAFSTYDLFTAQGIMNGAEKAGLPVIAMIGAPVLNKQGNEEIGRLMVRLADKAKVPVVVFLDHAKDFESCMKAIRLGFSAVMIDGSHLSFDENVQLTKKVVTVAKAVGVSVEGEIGALAGVEDGEGVVSSKMTNPDDVPRFADLTGVDALAISIGNAHGLYKGKPNLNFGILEKSAKLTQTPLVLHGGTGIEKKQFARAIDLGIKKVNIGTEVKCAFMDTFTKLHSENKEAYDLVGIPQAIKQAVAEVAEKDLKFFAEQWREYLK
ncbi:class II fructose-bisphosphate aldolase [Sporomusa acidovorans]|uniref:Fructose-bisphosphate aldolase n=1 Tax=Sporomusa acidovorans (strain ATCC 49682 / DSM 3132 / Mol) TaxID=1123286 RepID=A0ABZ3J7E9_SPOA4|nr:class II fructose-bisphosphate aldolase [Sporomusa acidovorans]OZC21266.1 fructose-bisphosphate aldolase [Sporomusa acidovorans DSM 3132]SDE66441.1 fructose-bisphosphate aldolase, class II [Sporomusa acidovorans]